MVLQNIYGADQHKPSKILDFLARFNRKKTTKQGGFTSLVNDESFLSSSEKKEKSAFLADDSEKLCVFCLDDLKDYKNGESQAICEGGHVVHKDCWRQHLTSRFNKTKTCVMGFCDQPTLISREDEAYVENIKGTHDSEIIKIDERLLNVLLIVASQFKYQQALDESEAAFLRRCQNNPALVDRAMSLLPQ